MFVGGYLLKNSLRARRKTEIGRGRGRKARKGKGRASPSPQPPSPFSSYSQSPTLWRLATQPRLWMVRCHMEGRLTQPNPCAKNARLISQYFQQNILKRWHVKGTGSRLSACSLIKILFSNLFLILSYNNATHIYLYFKLQVYFRVKWSRI